MSKLKIPTVSTASEDDLFEPAVVMPAIDQDVPHPGNKKPPEMSAEQELEVRTNTIKAIADINGDDITPSKEHQEQAKDLAREMMSNKKLKPEFVDRKEALKDKPVLKARTTVYNDLHDPATARWMLERKRKQEFSTLQNTKHSGEIKNKLEISDDKFGKLLKSGRKKRRSSKAS